MRAHSFPAQLPDVVDGVDGRHGFAGCRANTRGVIHRAAPSKPANGRKPTFVCRSSTNAVFRLSGVAIPAKSRSRESWITK
jgi:hypothetical protein